MTDETQLKCNVSSDEEAVRAGGQWPGDPGVQRGRGDGGEQHGGDGQVLYCTVLYSTVLYCTVVMVSTDKYTRDMFYLVPFYHREIPPTLTRIIAIDIDLDVR